MGNLGGGVFPAGGARQSCVIMARISSNEAKIRSDWMSVSAAKAERNAIGKAEDVSKKMSGIYSRAWDSNEM